MLASEFPCVIHRLSLSSPGFLPEFGGVHNLQDHAANVSPYPRSALPPASSLGSVTAAGHGGVFSQPLRRRVGRQCPGQYVARGSMSPGAMCRVTALTREHETADPGARDGWPGSTRRLPFRVTAWLC